MSRRQNRVKDRQETAGKEEERRMEIIHSEESRSSLFVKTNCNGGCVVLSYKWVTYL